MSYQKKVLLKISRFVAENINMKSLIILSLIFLTGCMNLNSEVYEKGMNVKKGSVYLPSGNDPLKRGLKNLLNKNGWNVVVSSGNQVIRSDMGNGQSIYKDNVNIDYEIRVEGHKFDWCIFEASPAYTDVSVIMINLKTGKEAVNLYGEGCASEVFKKFDNALNYGILR